MKQDPQEVALFEIESNIDTLTSLDQLDKVYKYLKYRRNKLSTINAHHLIIGEEVSITGSAKIESGKIVKINRTRAVVDCYDKNRKQTIHYTVPFSMIRKINKEANE